MRAPCVGGGGKAFGLGARNQMWGVIGLGGEHPKKKKKRQPSFENGCWESGVSEEEKKVGVVSGEPMWNKNTVGMQKKKMNT